MPIAVACADIGRFREKETDNRFGWAIGWGNSQPSEWEGGVGITGFVDAVTEWIRRGRIALGFECPMWVPIDDEPASLTRSRCVDWVRSDNGRKLWRPWSAAAGTAVTAVGLSQISWILERIRMKVTQCPEVFFDWKRFAQAESGVFFWEALVSGGTASRAEAGSVHVSDAKAAVRQFFRESQRRDEWADPMPERCQNCELSECRHRGRVRSLIGGALLWADWSRDAALLHQPCVVVRTKKGS